MRLHAMPFFIIIVVLLQVVVLLPLPATTTTITQSQLRPGPPIRSQDQPTTKPATHDPQKLMKMKNTSISDQMKKEIKSEELSQKMAYLYLQIWRRIQLKDIKVPESYLFRYDQQLVKQLALMDQKDLQPGFNALEKVWIENRDYLDELDELFKKIEVHKTAMGRLWDNLATVKSFYITWSEEIRRQRHEKSAIEKKASPE